MLAKKKLSETIPECNVLSVRNSDCNKNVIEPIYANVTLNDIKGFDDAKEDLKVHVSPLKIKTLSNKYNV